MFHLFHNAESNLPSSQKQQLLDQHMQEAEVNRSLTLQVVLKIN